MILWVSLGAITVLSFVLRFGAVDRLLPVRPDPDPSLAFTYQILSGQEVDQPELYYGVYPLLLPRTLALVLGPKALRAAPVGASLEDHLHAAGAPFRHVRGLSALLAFLLAPVGYWIARRWVGDAWALLGAAMIATALLHVVHSASVKAHGAHATLAWLTLLCALRQVEAPLVRRVAATAIASGLAIGVFHSGLFTLAPLLVAGWMSRRASNRISVAVWLAPLLALSIGLAFTPGGIDFTSGRVRLGSGHTIELQNLDGSGLRIWLALLWEHDPLLALLAGLGSLLALTHLREALRDPVSRSRLLVVASYVIPYTVLISLDRTVQDRYLLPIYPVLAILAIVPIRAALEPLRRPALAVVACLLVLAMPGWTAARYALWLGRRPDTIRQAARWLEAQPDALRLRVQLTPGLALPLYCTREALDAQLATPPGRANLWLRYLGKLPALPASAPAYDLRSVDPTLFAPSGGTSTLFESYLDRERPDLLMIEVSDRVRTTIGGVNLRELARRRAELVAVFSGEDESRAFQTPIDYQYARAMAARTLSATCLGPRIEVYRWPQ